MEQIQDVKKDEDRKVKGDSNLPSPSYPPTRADWTAYRSTITRFYWEHDRTLPETIQIMKEEFNFRATKRMYGQRITEWGLKKNRTAAERAEITRVIKGYQARGEENPISLVNDRPVNMPLVKRHEHFGTMIKSFRKQSTARAGPIPPIQSPGHLKWVETIIYQTDIFYEVDVETRLRTNMQNSAEIEIPGAEPKTILPTDFINANQGAMEAIVKGNLRVGWRQLNESLDMLGPLFRSKSSYVIIELLDCASQWPRNAPPDVSRAVWRHIADMAASVLGKNDPTAMICNALTHLESRDEIYEATQNSLQLILRKFELHLGQDTPPAIATKAKYTRLLADHGKLDEAEKLQIEVVQQRKRVYGSGQHVTLSIYRLAKLLRQKRDFEGSEIIFLDALQRSRADMQDDIKDRNTGTVNVALAMFIVIDFVSMFKDAGKEDLAHSENLLQESLDRCCRHCEFFEDWKMCGPYLVDYLPVIDDVLRRQGKVAEADMLRLRFSDYISAIDDQGTST